MKRRFMLTILFFLLFFAFAILLIYFCLSSAKESISINDNLKPSICQYKYAAAPIDTDGNPLWIKDSADDKSWSNFSIPGKPPVKNNNSEVWVRIKLANETFREPSIFFITYDQIFEVYLDNKIIYKYGSFDDASKKKSPGSPWHLIDLPDNFQGKYIYFKMYGVRPVNTGYIKVFNINNKSTHIFNIIKDGLPTTLLAFTFIFIGTCSFCLFFIKNTNKQIFIYLSAATITTGIWLFACGTMQQFLLNRPVFWTYVDIISQYLIPFCFIFLLKNILPFKNKIIYDIIATISGLLIVVSLLLDAFHILPLVCTLPAFYIIFALDMLICLYIIIRSFRNWNLETKIISVAFITICCTGVIDILNWNFNNGHANVFFTTWGMLIFNILLALVVILNFIKTKEKVNEYSEEIRTKELILLEKKREIEEAIINDKIKTEFFSNISHELRTPLNIILSTVQLLFLYEKDESIKNGTVDLKKYLKIMKQNSYRLIRLVNNIIDLTKIDSDYINLQLQNYNIISVVEDITLSVADYIKSKGISLTFDTDVEERIIACDPDKIERILLNLLSNAVKFSNYGSSIFVDIQNSEDEVVITVKDTGIGIEKEKLDMIFERFAQVDKSLKREHEGSGIGLCLVKSLVTMHGGTIKVESEYGKGSSFTITLPSKYLEGDGTDKEKQEIQAVHVEKVNIEFSDIYS